MELFPAVMIGGPPHSGKSVLIYSLTQALRKIGVAHYVLRSAPDGEGDWANEADQQVVRQIRPKGKYSPEWVNYMCQDIANRHLPLLVDVGGRPTAWQEAVFGYCSHAILLTPDEPARRVWGNLAAKHGLSLLADLHSSLNGDDFVQSRQPFLQGQICRLERGIVAKGSVFQALIEVLSNLFAYDDAELRRMHLALAPVELTVEVGRIGQTLGFGPNSYLWSPENLPALLDYVPPMTALALYDRGPNWLYAALARHAYPAELYQFDVRLGWISPPD